jgi:hypothetical protein
MLLRRLQRRVDLLSDAGLAENMLVFTGETLFAFLLYQLLISLLQSFDCAYMVVEPLNLIIYISLHLS